MSDDTEDAVFLGAGVKKEQLLLRLANRNCLITGAAGKVALHIGGEHRHGRNG